jgi:glutathione S-transferase
MSFPLLKISGDYAHVEVRQGKGAQRWEEMSEIFKGAATKGQEWKGGEGDKLSARHCQMPDNPNSTLSLPYSVAGSALLDVGKPRKRVFPASIGGGSSLSFKSMEAAPGFILHEYAPSGNCYKIRLTAALLGVDLERRDYDIMTGETRTREFLTQVNANGRIPVLQIGERFLPESNAAAFWLADGSALVPEDRFERADMLRWMFWEQYNHEPNIATLRFWLAFVGRDRLSEAQQAQVEGKQAAGVAALQLMEEHLQKADWLVGSRATLADICLYAYTHVAEEGDGFDLSHYPAVGRWLDRVTALPGFITIND